MQVQFSSNGHTCAGWLASPRGGQAPSPVTGPAIVVVQEWWGIDAHIKDVVERFAGEGFLALAPDLYHGKVASSPDEAQKLLMELDIERARAEIAGAGAYLLGRPECSSKSYGVVGFCMGGALAQYAATTDPSVGAAVSFYGGFQKVKPEWERLSAPILLIYGEKDKGVPADKGRELAKSLQSMGKKAEAVVYEGAEHAFFNDTKPRYKADAAKDAWSRTVAHFRANVR